MSLFGMTSYVAIAESGVWQHVQTQVLGAAAASVSFTGLAGDAFYMLTTFTAKDSATNNPAFAIRVNNDSGANYATSRFQQNGGTRSGSAVASQTSWATVSTLGATGIGGVITIISKPAAGVRGQMHQMANVDAASLAMLSEHDFGDWNNTSATISRIDVLVASDQFAAGTSVRLDRKAAA